MRPRFIRDDACAQGRTESRILEDHIERIVHSRTLALPQRSGVNGLRLAEQDKSPIEEVRPEIPQDPCGRKVRHFTPCAGLGIETKTVEADFVFLYFAERSFLDQFLYGKKRAIPPPVLINRKQLSSLLRDAHEFLRFLEGRGHRLVEHHVATCLQAGLRVRKVRVVRSRHNAQIYALVGKHLVETARNAHFRITLLRVIRATFEHAGEFHPLDSADHGSVESLSSQTESDQSYSYHLLFLRRAGLISYDLSGLSYGVRISARTRSRYRRILS